MPRSQLPPTLRTTPIAPVIPVAPSGIDGAPRMETLEEHVQLSAGHTVIFVPADQVLVGEVLVEVDAASAHLAATPTSGWIRAPGDAFVVVAHTTTRICLTTCKPVGSGGVRLELRRLDQALSLPAPPPPPAPRPLAIGTAHVAQLGEHAASLGARVGVPTALLCGFCLPVPEYLEDHWVEYQAILGFNWSTPWIPLGQACGSRDDALPMVGLRVRLTEAAPEHLLCTLHAEFGRGQLAPEQTGRCVEVYAPRFGLSTFSLQVA